MQSENGFLLKKQEGEPEATTGNLRNTKNQLARNLANRSTTERTAPTTRSPKKIGISENTYCNNLQNLGLKSDEPQIHPGTIFSPIRYLASSACMDVFRQHANQGRTPVPRKENLRPPGFLQNVSDMPCILGVYGPVYGSKGVTRWNYRPRAETRKIAFRNAGEIRYF